MFCPDVTASSMPAKSWVRAAAASSRHACAKASELMPAAFAQSSRASLPVATATSISDMVREMAEPPIWASIPTELREAASPRTCASLRPIWPPAPAILMAISMMAASVVAELLPSPTMVAPIRSMSVVAVPMMFMKRASCIEPSSRLRFVATSRSPMTDANLER